MSEDSEKICLSLQRFIKSVQDYIKEEDLLPGQFVIHFDLDYYIDLISFNFHETQFISFGGNTTKTVKLKDLDHTVHHDYDNTYFLEITK